MIKVLVVDDSAVVRQTMCDVLNSDAELTVMGTANDPFMAAKKLRDEVPDVITLDVEMPRMDGITFLRKLMNQHPIPVVICSSLAEKGCETTLKALEYGAVDIIEKPKVGTKAFLEESAVMVCDAVKAAAQAKVRRVKAKSHGEPGGARPKLSADAMLPPPSRAMDKTTDKVIVIGASTGGTEALKDVLTQLPGSCPGIVIVQHMPESFTASFATRLNGLCAMDVKEAKKNDTVYPGRVLIAPGNKHMLLQRSGARYHVDVKNGPLVSRHRPSVDVLMRSAARYAGKNVVAAILTGMGDDGAKGMSELKQAGAATIAQDEATCVVYGMPKEAVAAGGVDFEIPLQDIPRKILDLCRT